MQHAIVRIPAPHVNSVRSCYIRHQLKAAATKPMAANEGEKLEQAEKAKLDKLLEKNPCDM